MRTHQVDQVDPRQIGTLRADTVNTVEGLVQDADRLIRLADLVGVRIEQDRAIRRVVVVAGTPLTVQIARRTFDLGEEGFDSRPQVDPCHRSAEPVGAVP